MERLGILIILTLQALVIWYLSTLGFWGVAAIVMLSLIQCSSMLGDIASNKEKIDELNGKIYDMQRTQASNETVEKLYDRVCELEDRLQGKSNGNF